MSKDEFTFEVRRTVTLSVLLCKECGAKETNAKHWLIAYNQEKSKFRYEWLDNNKTFFCKACNKRVAEGFEEQPVMIHVDLHYLRNEIDCLINRELTNSSKRS
jgi:hypothetical protein